MEGTYTLSAAVSVPNNTTLEGAGTATIITLPNSQNGTYNMITNSDTSTGTNVTIENLLIDGNKANQASGNMAGVLFNGMGSGTRAGGNITDVTVQNIYASFSSTHGGIVLSSSSGNTVSGNTSNSSSGNGISLSSSLNNTITGNMVSGNGQVAIYIQSSSKNTVGGNIVRSNSEGI